MKRCVRCDSRHVVFVSDDYGWHCSGNCGAATEVSARTTAKTTVLSSSGDRAYEITDVDGRLRCECMGFTFRGSCKHLREISGRKVA